MEKIKTEVIDNFLPDDEFKIIRDRISGSKFPWFYKKGVAYTDSNDGIYFTHMFFDDFDRKNEDFPLIMPILKKLNPKALIRIKANCYLRTLKLIKHGLHVDYKWGPTNGMVFSINDCDGGTFLSEKNQLIASKANRAIVFDATLGHASTSCTDKDVRLNINFNYFGDGDRGLFPDH